MKLVVGFGNPENKYNFTRHNYGFLTLDFYTKIKGLNWEQNPKFNAIWLKTSINGEQTIFIKPQTYYNEVGQA
ncbi:aminoacyl-tRNA hydrolase, partial [Candidatus Saccharibacteria bacterium]|nr:aminoacyl-tRNA hydrolase [Candidatus Saccharibacteria bacterium]